NAISLVRLSSERENPAIETVVLDEPNRGFADPSDVCITPDGRLAFIACAGGDAVLAIDLPRLLDYLAKRGKASPPYGPRDDLTASRHFIKARLATESNPRRLGLSGDGKTLAVSNYLGESLTVIDVAQLKVVRHIPLGKANPDASRRGELLFNSGRMTFQGQF